jgi:hypothetical protein
VTTTAYLTALGRALTWDRFRNLGATAYPAEPKNIGWGTGGAAGGPFTAAPADVGLFSEAPEARAAGASSVVTTATANDTYLVTGTLTCAQAGGEAITEMLLSDSASKPVTALAAAGGVVGSPAATTLNTSAPFSPGNGAYVQVRTEVMQVTAGSGTASLTVVRGANGSTAISSVAASDVVTAGNAPGSTAAANGNCYVHASFGALNLSLGDSINFSASVQLI